ncbi:hypothetical protein BN6_33710 [Saccharothrix espanaensis DSM 44229]|uniref:Uncharacterized protein n=1 Tax=Saccharothrix espanaensis (strain ATCC 51144 / DSM 44229 / JCM 9112 / NBRC 15066 / NRRL 15764) TaxID=1179773 RepID=K0K2A8_SACES|nr:hypothetical protein BN6_33710 [Saccharothrix espanaensis DSM 44229]
MFGQPEAVGDGSRDPDDRLVRNEPVGLVGTPADQVQHRLTETGMAAAARWSTLPPAMLKPRSRAGSGGGLRRSCELPPAL